MPTHATTEFWKDLAPIAESFKPDASPEVHIANAPTDDERYLSIHCQSSSYLSCHQRKAVSGYA